MTANLTLGILLLVALALAIALHAGIAARRARHWRNRADGAGGVDTGIYLCGGSDFSGSSGCDGGSSGGDCG